jgi:hypothetical protein
LVAKAVDEVANLFGTRAAVDNHLALFFCQLNELRVDLG